MDLPEDPGARWMALMRRGDWAAAWALSDAAIAARAGQRDWALPRHLQAVWDGTALSGRRVLVRCYHGLGDTIQFIRLVPCLQAVAREVTVWAQPALIPLLSTMRAAPHLLPLHDGTPDCDYDTDIEIMELAHALRITPATLPSAAPYLHPPAPPRQPREGIAVGIAWQAGDWNPCRSVPVELLAPLAAIEGVTLHILQRGPELARRPAGFGFDTGSDDILTAASRICRLDLVISVDSMPAHLAGALGVPVWVLLAKDADWRWMEGREDSPWYPTMRLFRQLRAGDWSEPVMRLRVELEALARR